jgi:glutathione S-transferase
MNPALTIGNKNYSSWSLRPWLLLKVKGIGFDETRIPLYQQQSKAAILAESPSGKVPALRHGSVSVWESLAICEYIAEQWPQMRCWPTDPAARALARSISAEMHAGFGTLRSELPMNCRRAPAPAPQPASAAIAADLTHQIHRIDAIWSACRADARSGDFLFGDFGVADAMFAPVVLRFSIYEVAVSGAARAYMHTMLALPALKEWVVAAQSESEVLARFER